MIKTLTLDVTSFKFADNETDLSFRAMQNGVIISDSTLSATIKIKQVDVGYLKSVSAKWVDKRIVISSGDLSDLPVGSYSLELWLSSPSGYEIYPDSGFVNLYINQNATGISGNLISSITLGEFQQQFSDLAEELRKDAISSPEIIEARNGETSLNARLTKNEQEVTAQLAQKVEKGEVEAEKARLEDIAVGAYGELYDSPGTAVRTQFTKVNSKVDKFKDTDKFLSLTEDSTNFLKTESAYVGSTGYITSSAHNSYEVTLPNETILYFENYDAQYTSLCVFTSGIVGGEGYTRYRMLAGGENTLPTSDTRITLQPGTVIIVSVSKANGNFNLMQNGELNGFYLSNAVKLNTEQIKQLQSNANTYLLTYLNDELAVNGNGVNCVFNTKTFTNKDGLFELQNLTYNNDVIFGTNNDYIGPLRVNGESIKGAKHNGEVTDSVLITTDKGVLQNGETVEASKFTVFVKSHISDEFSRVSSYSFDGNTMTTHSIITTLKDLQIDYVFGAGIISCQDDVNVAWLNKKELSTEVLIGLNEQTSIICQNGTLISKRLTVNSNYGDKRVSFTTYPERKKLYYYTCYGNNIAVPSGTVFASSTELAFS